MRKYVTNFVSLDVSDDWVDQSLTAFKIPAKPGTGDSSFVVTHDATRGGQEFPAYFASQQDKCSKSLGGFKLIRSDLLFAHDRSMGWLEFTWDANGRTMLIRQIHFDCNPLAVICTFTVAPADMPQLDGRWQEVMASLQFPPAQQTAAFQPQANN